MAREKHEIISSDTECRECRNSKTLSWGNSHPLSQSELAMYEDGNALFKNITVISEGLF